MVSQYGYTTVARVASRLRTTIDATTTPSLTEVEDLISENEFIINKYSGKEYTDANVHTNELYDHVGGNSITLKNGPVQSVSSVEYSSDGGLTWTALSSSDYVVDSDYRRIERAQNGTKWPGRGVRNVRISYTSGYSSVPLDIRQLATDMTVAEVIRSVVSKSANSEGGRISVGAISIDKSMFSPDTLDMLDQKVVSKLNRLSSGSNFTTIGKTW